MSVNLHHIELFYYVASSGGISAAVRKMPYSIQQPAVSSQVAQLEKDLGVRLFHRRPFELTSEGRELFEFCQPFFSGINPLVEKVSDKAYERLRVAAPVTVIRHYLPDVLEETKRQFPQLELQLFDSEEGQIRELFAENRIDLAISEVETAPPAGIRLEMLLELPLTLFFHKSFDLKNFNLEQLCETYSLIRPNDNYTISRLFEKGLKKRGLKWESSLEINLFDLQLNYVARGFGISLGVDVPQMSLPAGVHSIQLDDFPNFKVGAMWKGELTGPAKQVFQSLKDIASSH